jgi:hypothetical protein
MITYAKNIKVPRFRITIMSLSMKPKIAIALIEYWNSNMYLTFIINPFHYPSQKSSPVMAI